MIEPQTIVYYIIIQLTQYKIWVYYFVIRICFVLIKTSDSYLSNILSVFVFDNIHICIHIRFENMKTDMGKALLDPHLIRFHP
jgi:hypothetical protein